MAKQLSAFEKEFKAARDRGAKDFEFNGKSYNTKLKDDSAPASKTSSKTEEEKSSTGSDSASKNLGSAVGSRKVQPDFTPGKVPSSEQASANRAAVVDTAKSVAGSIGDYVRNFKTPAERRSEEAKNPTPKAPKSDDTNEDALSSGSAMKRGGSVKKMASGGMASSRADGIAQRGKTRGKMC
jgi:hypothetical protein